MCRLNAWTSGLYKDGELHTLRTSRLSHQVGIYAFVRTVVHMHRPCQDLLRIFDLYISRGKLSRLMLTIQIHVQLTSNARTYKLPHHCRLCAR